MALDEVAVHGRGESSHVSCKRASLCEADDRREQKRPEFELELMHDTGAACFGVESERQLGGSEVGGFQELEREIRGWHPFHYPKPLTHPARGRGRAHPPDAN